MGNGHCPAPGPVIAIAVSIPVMTGKPGPIYFLFRQFGN